ncbi:MAG: SGNH/GDSL hydrolase family protein [Chloroflexi bacterium]|nr:SGNH/GDSL hydrolase family protein [Chloroflexota bacterium]
MTPHKTGPFQRMVVLGDSIAYGMCAYEASNEWNQVVATLLRKFQDEPLTVFNRALPASVISPRCPGYIQSCKPSLLERYHRHCIDLKPDLVILAQGLNDMRSGMPIKDYVEDLETIVADINSQTNALIVLVGTYHQIYGKGGNDPATHPTWVKWDHKLMKLYNSAIRLVAQEQNALFVDAQAVLGGADWTLHPDACHLNDLGHVLIGNAIFQTIATSAIGIAAKTLRIIEENAVTTLNTGGSDTGDDIQHLWEAALERYARQAHDQVDFQ